MLRDQKDAEFGKSALRVLLLNEYFYPDDQGGTATATTNIARQLTDRHGVHVTVLTGRHSYRTPSREFAPREEWNGVDIHRVKAPNWTRKRTPVRFAGNVLLAMAMLRAARRLPKPDVVLVTTAPLTLPIVAMSLLKRRRIPYVYLIYDLDPERTVALGLKQPNEREVLALRRHQEKWLNSAARVIAIGRCMRDRLIESYRLAPDKIKVVEVGADPSLVAPHSPETRFRSKHGLTGFIALYSGNFGQYHEFRELLDAAERLPEITFVLVGGGHKHSQVESEVTRRTLANVRLFEFVPADELSDLMASADVHLVTLSPGMEGLCVPSKFYTCLASARPVVAILPRNSEVARVIDEAECGSQVDPEDVDALVSVLAKYVADPALRRLQGDNGNRAFQESYTSEKVVDKLALALSEAVTDHQ